MNTTDRIMKIIKNSGLTDSFLVKELNLSNGIIGQWRSKKQKPSAEAIKKIADYFNVTTDYLLGRTDDPKHTSSLDEQLEGVDFALWGEVKDMTDAQKQDILDYIRFKKQQRSD